MSYDVIAVHSFKRELKRLCKKYPSLQNDLTLLFESLEENPIQGIHIGNECYKIRLAITSKGKGKSGGARVITNFVVRDGIVYLLSIYDKSERENISENELAELLNQIEK